MDGYCRLAASSLILACVDMSTLKLIIFCTVLGKSFGEVLGKDVQIKSQHKINNLCWLYVI
ncbi:Uncharacterised protein [Edwardsiella hoshinae]|uniref:Uncharacterized protein n=1 Tax=Edwardsiella hoshinae TaxID=93378 RepID=A0A376DDT8_9GAMM|nr:Uncharacterised protein [Edwardsiella hoshinae]